MKILRVARLESSIIGKCAGMESQLAGSENPKGLTLLPDCVP